MGSVRTILADDGSVWFVGKDVGEALGLGAGLSNAYARFENTEKATIPAASLSLDSNKDQTCQSSYRGNSISTAYKL